MSNLLPLLLCLLADPVGPSTPWVFEVVSLHNGASFSGLVLKEDTTSLEFQVVRRSPGRPTVTFSTSFLKREVAHVKRLVPADRQLLMQRLAALDPLNEGERQQMEALELQTTDWLGLPGQAKLYSSELFILRSGAPEEVTRRAAVRLEQVYAAFTQVLPPRTTDTTRTPTKIYLAGTMTDYRKLLGPSIGPLLNPAIYDVKNQRIICGSDLTKLGEELATKRVQATKQRQELAQYELQIRKLYKNSKPDLDRFLEKVNSERKRLRDAEKANEAIFDQATKRLFALLYHESFHDYVTSYYFPNRSTAELPRWLNEGLAQIFETAILEAGELRFDHADPVRLERAKALLKAGGAGLIPLEELLSLNNTRFLAVHTDQTASADQVYLTCWAVTLYLTFEKRAIGNKDFVDFLKPRPLTEQSAAFRTWTGLDPKQLDQDLKKYLLKLPPDGNLNPKP